MNVGINRKDTSVKDDLLIQFHQQFSENYNHQQNLFVKILSVVIIAFTGYGVVLEKTLNQHDFFCDKMLLQITTIIVMLVMSFLSFILIFQGWGFRRSQVIVYGIRCHFFKEQAEIYFENYGKSVDTLPGFYSLNVYMCEILKIVTIIITLFTIKVECLYIWLVFCLEIVLIFFERMFYEQKRAKVKKSKEKMENSISKID